MSWLQYLSELAPWVAGLAVISSIIRRLSKDQKERDARFMKAQENTIELLSDHVITPIKESVVTNTNALKTVVANHIAHSEQERISLCEQSARQTDAIERQTEQFGELTEALKSKLR